MGRMPAAREGNISPFSRMDSGRQGSLSPLARVDMAMERRNSSMEKYNRDWDIAGQHQARPSDEPYRYNSTGRTRQQVSRPWPCTLSPAFPWTICLDLNLSLLLQPCNDSRISQAVLQHSFLSASLRLLVKK